MTASRRGARQLVASVALAVSSFALTQPAAAQRPAGPLKVYISADMEGITGVASVDQLGPGSFEYERAREWMTGEVLAAIQGARDAGATEFVVSDSHGNGESLLIDRFPTDVPITIVRSFPRPLGMMEGIDSIVRGGDLHRLPRLDFEYDGVRAHTISSALLTRISLNGISMSEAGINAAIAAEYGVPVVMLTGDDAIVGGNEAATRSDRRGRREARDRLPLDSHDDAGDGAPAHSRSMPQTALKRRGEMKPYSITRPITLEVSFKNYRPVELLGYLSNVQRIDSHTVRYVARNMLDVSKFIEFVTSYEPTLSP